MGSAPPPELRPEAGPLALTFPCTLWLDIDLRQAAFVNLDFRDTTQRSIPLHLSLRRDTGQVVANRWTPKGWRREIPFSAPLRRGVHTLRLDFHMTLGTSPAVTLSLDGNIMGRLDAFPRLDPSARLRLRRGFPGLLNIGWMTWPDGLRQLHHASETGSHALQLTPRLELALSGPYGGAWCDLGEGAPGVPFVQLTPGPDSKSDWQSLALLPGRIWQGHDAESVGLIARSGTGDKIAQRVVRRTDILALLQRDDMAWLLRHDTVARLQVLEHVHYANLWPEVPQAFRMLIAPDAQRLSKAGFTPPMGLPVPAKPQAPAAAACDAFHRALSQDPYRDPEALFHAVACTLTAGAPEIRLLALMLSEWFCLNADPRRLAAAAHAHGVADWGTVTEPWGQIAALPMVWASGDWRGCAQILRCARQTRASWVVTPALGWIASALAQDWPDLQGARPPLANRGALILVLMDLIAELAPAYMSQAGCHRLLEGVCDLLASSDSLPDKSAEHLATQVLRAYGLNADFWAHFDRRVAHLPLSTAQLQPLLRWKAAFVRLSRACAANDGPEMAKAARPFFSQKTAGWDSLLRIVMSKLGLPQDSADLSDLDALTGNVAQDRIDEVALRWLAFPRPEAERKALALSPRSSVHRAACAGLRVAASDVARPPMSQAQLALGRELQSLLTSIRSGHPPDAPILNRTIGLARKLIAPECDFVGLAALLALAEALERGQERQLASHCIAVALADLRMDLRGAAAQCPAIALAVARFDALCPDAALRAQVHAILARDQSLAPPPAEDVLAARLRAGTNPFCDTLVALISCRAYLEGRVPAIKAAWGDALACLGIPMITVVGRAAGQRPGCGTRFDGELLELDAPDDYEGLPQKTLALADWALTQTGFGRVFKIDDDCFLNVEGFFTDPAFLNIPYFGRPLHRKLGDMDRAWHMGRSQSPRGRLEIDKSPEPSVYADGGSGYVLSRPALAALLAARSSSQGQSLEQVSFMEDKLVGDLLALRGIAVAGPNYDLAIFRSTGPGLAPVSQYSSGFLPFAGSDLKLAHLDAGGAPLTARAALASPWPVPMKIWPCHRPAQLGWAKNALDLASPPERLEQARKADVAVISVMRNERFMLDHFLAHYRRLGVGAFLIVDNGSEDGTLEYLVAQPDVSVFSTDTPYRNSAYGVMWQEALMAQFRLGRWSLLADADELAFFNLPQADGTVHGDLPGLLDDAAFAGADAVRFFMFDLYPKGAMAAARFSRSPFLDAGYVDRAPLRHDWQGRGPWSNCATVTSALRHRLMEEAGTPARANLFVAQKYALLRYHPFLKLSTGLHYVTGAVVAPRDLGFAHFKYHAEFHAKAVAEAMRGQHFNNAEEYRSYLILQAEGRETFYDPAVSVRLSACAAVRALCDLPQDATVAALRSGPPCARGVQTRRALASPLCNPVQGIRAM